MMRGEDSFLRSVPCCEAEREAAVILEKPEGGLAVRMVGGSAASSSGGSSVGSAMGWATSSNLCVRLGGLIEGGFAVPNCEERESGREDLVGVRGLLTLREFAMGLGKVSEDMTSKESRRSEMTSGSAGLTRTSLGLRRGSPVRAAEGGPKEGGAAAS